MKSPFLVRLDSGPLLADGGMGTMLYALGIPYQRCFDELNLSQPELVQRVHREYIAAGAELIETNTFGANRFKLATHGLDRRVRDINLRGVKVAREAREVTGEPVFLAGAVGPIGRPLAPVGTVSPAQAREAFQEQIEALLEGGADLLILETFSDLAELREAVCAARSVTDLPLVAQVTFTEEGQTVAGEDPAEVARLLVELGADVVGVNCGVGPQAALDVVERMRSSGVPHISALPNAGFPARVEGLYVYVTTPEYFAEYACRFRQAGLALLGGCCGTTPAHIRAMRAALDETHPRPHTAVVVQAPRPAPEPAPAGTEGPTGLARRLAAGEFVVSVELDPPKGLNPGRILEGAALLRDAGVDCINIGDSPMARVRMSALALALLLKERLGLESIIHFTTRDRNLMALQSELLGAHALGIRNVLALTGDPPAVGNYPHATGVWDVDSAGLVSILKRMNQGLDWAGNSIGRAAAFTVGCALNPTAEDPRRELERFKRKVDAGADFAMSQPIYALDQLLRFLDLSGPLPIPLILGIMPLQSYKHAEFLHHELPGVTIPADVRERMRQAGEHGLEEGAAQARELLEAARPYVQGVYIMPSFHRYEMAAELVRSLRAPAAAS